NEAKQSFAVGGDYYEPVSSADSSLVVEDLIVVGVEELLVSDLTKTIISKVIMFEP
ncbi:MAG: hypothetical protein EZS28_034302, partial [Streblomastix strix]